MIAMTDQCYQSFSQDVDNGSDDSTILGELEMSSWHKKNNDYALVLTFV